MRLSVGSTSARTFVIVPLTAITESRLAHRRWRPGWAFLLGWGWAQYELVGRRRLREAGGPPGMSQGTPERLVTDGVYALTRNPMYLGHLVFLTGLALVTRSPVATGYLLWSLPWFDQRASRDEGRLHVLFGEAYDTYCDSVPRWLPMGTTGRPR